MHGAQVEVAFAVRIVLAEEVAEHGTEVEEAFGTHNSRSWVWQDNTRVAGMI